MNSTTKKTVTAAMFTALCCVATMIIKIPSPLKGYINLGDCIVLSAGFTLSPVYAFLSAGIGSALADVFSGYVFYAPATFAIKGITALAAAFGFKILCKKAGKNAARILSAAVAEAIMVIGYFVFEGFMYGFAPSAVNIPANVMQGVAGLVLGVVITGIIDRYKIAE